MTEPSIPNGWTIASYAAHNEALRQAQYQFEKERDRRYSEVNIEKEKALKIKETADLAALQLARDIQIYKDEKANELREQINSERGLYVTKNDLTAAIERFDAIIAPLAFYVTSQQGRQQQTVDTRQQTTGQVSAIYGGVGAIVGIAGIIIAGVALAAK